MKKKLPITIIFTASVLVLLISLALFWNMGIYADEYNTSPAVVCGGGFWLIADWLRLALSAVIVLVSGSRLLKR